MHALELHEIEPHDGIIPLKWRSWQVCNPTGLVGIDRDCETTASASGFDSPGSEASSSEKASLGDQ
jgi:hypothetical protein